MLRFIQILLVVCFSVSSVHAGVRTCGQKGSIQERMRDCHRKNPKISTRTVRERPVRDENGDWLNPPGGEPVYYTWSIVEIRQSERSILWFDGATGLVWTTTAQPSMQFWKAQDYCEDSDEGLREKLSLGLQEKFRVASLDEWLQALRHGLFVVLQQHSSRIFWTATEKHDSANRAWAINGRTGGTVQHLSLSQANSVRCITGQGADIRKQ